MIYAYVTMVYVVDAHLHVDLSRSLADQLRDQNRALGCRQLVGLQQLTPHD